MSAWIKSRLISIMSRSHFSPELCDRRLVRSRLWIKSLTFPVGIICNRRIMESWSVLDDDSASLRITRKMREGHYLDCTQKGYYLNKLISPILLITPSFCCWDEIRKTSGKMNFSFYISLYACTCNLLGFFNAEL